MASFQYRGRNKSGLKVEGIIEAVNDIVVAQKLYNIDVVPISIERITRGFQFKEWFLQLWHKPDLEEITVFTQQMYALLKGGVPLLQALRVVSDTTEQAQLRNSLMSIVISLEAGNSLSKSFAIQAPIFSPLFIALIEVGENTGHLEEAFLQINHYLKKDLATQRKLKSALRYPTALFFTLIAAIFVINLMIIPSFKDFFDAFAGTLPFATRLLIGMSNIFTQHTLLLISIFIILGVSSFVVLRSPQGKWWLAYYQLKIPFLGPIIQKAAYARFCRAFSLTQKAGMPLFAALKISAPVVDNLYICNHILQLMHYVEQGDSLYMSAKKLGIFSPLVMQMLALSEETGELADNLNNISSFYEKEIDYKVKKLGDNFEPILIAILAIMVLILALGVFLPMWDISTVALKKMEGG